MAMPSRSATSRGETTLTARLFDGLRRGVLIAESIQPNKAHIGGRGINMLTGRRSRRSGRRRGIPRQQGLGEEGGDPARANSRLQSTAILPQMFASSWQTGERDND